MKTMYFFSGLAQLANINTDSKDKITLISSYHNSEVDFTYIHQTEVILYMKAYILSLLDHGLPQNVSVDYLSFKGKIIKNHICIIVITHFV